LQECERLGEEPERVGVVLVEGAEFVDCLGDDLLVVEREVGDGVVDPAQWADGGVVALPEQPGEAFVGDHDGVGHGQDPAAGVAGGAVEDAELVGARSGDAVIRVASTLYGVPFYTAVKLPPDLRGPRRAQLRWHRAAYQSMKKRFPLFLTGRESVSSRRRGVGPRRRASTRQKRRCVRRSLP